MAGEDVAACRQRAGVGSMDVFFSFSDGFCWGFARSLGFQVDLGRLRFLWDLGLKVCFGFRSISE